MLPRSSHGLVAAVAFVMAGCQLGFVCEPDRPDDNGAASSPGCPGAPEVPASAPPTSAQLSAYAAMPAPLPPSDYALPPPSSVSMTGGKVTQVTYRAKDGTLLARGIDTDGNGVIDTYTKYAKGRAQSQTRDSDGNGTLDLRYIDVDGDGQVDVKSSYPATDPTAPR